MRFLKKGGIGAGLDVLGVRAVLGRFQHREHCIQRHDFGGDAKLISSSLFNARNLFLDLIFGSPRHAEMLCNSPYDDNAGILDVRPMLNELEHPTEFDSIQRASVSVARNGSGPRIANIKDGRGLLPRRLPDKKESNQREQGDRAEDCEPA